jgi:hypothetical protein
VTGPPPIDSELEPNGGGPTASAPYEPALAVQAYTMGCQPR